METEIEALREKLRGKRTKELKAEMLAFGEKRKRDGSTLTAIARELGLTENTLHAWRHNGKAKRKPKAAKFIELKPSASMPTRAGGFEIACPNGYRVKIKDAFTNSELLKVLQTVGQCCQAE